MTEKRILLDPDKSYYKGNMHCHSTLSDGKLTPQELKAAYKSQGYHFLALTDHEVLYDNSYLDDEDFLTITSTEYAIKEFSDQSTLKNLHMRVCHLNLYAKEQHNTNNVYYCAAVDHYSQPAVKADSLRRFGDHPRPYSAQTINDIIRTANENGFFVSYNHPRWSLENYGQYGQYEGLWGVEIYNTGVNMGGIYEYNIAAADDFLRDGKHIFVTCGDDNHNVRGLRDSFGAFVMVNARELSYGAIISALLQGDFYTSTGPTIESLVLEGNRVTIRCSEARQICLSTSGRYAQSKIAGEDGLLREAVFDIREDSQYFRLDVIDAFGNRANTQAYSLSGSCR